MNDLTLGLDYLYFLCFTENTKTEAHASYKAAQEMMGHGKKKKVSIIMLLPSDSRAIYLPRPIFILTICTKTSAKVFGSFPQCFASFC